MQKLHQQQEASKLQWKQQISHQIQLVVCSILFNTLLSVLFVYFFLFGISLQAFDVKGYTDPLQQPGRPDFTLSAKDVNTDSLSFLFIFFKLLYSFLSPASGIKPVTRYPRSVIVPSSLQGLEGIDFPRRRKEFGRTRVYDPLNPNYPRLSDGIGYVPLSAMFFPCSMFSFPLERLTTTKRLCILPPSVLGCAARSELCQPPTGSVLSGNVRSS